MKIICTGLSGLVGSRIAELLEDKYEFLNLSTSERFDITDKNHVFDVFKSNNSPVVIHLAGKTNVDSCEEDKKEDLEKLKLDGTQRRNAFNVRKTAWSVNVCGTENVALACEETGKRLIYISTDFVFDGVNKDKYVEDDVPNPINWYGRTKFEGEKIVSSLKTPWAILRIAFPFRASFEKKDFIRVIVGKLKAGEELNLVKDQYISPTFIDDLAPIWEFLISENISGIFHAGGRDKLSPFQIGEKIVEISGFEKKLIKEISRKEFFKGRAMRPFNSALRSDKLEKLGLKMRGFKEAFLEINRQI